MCNFFHTLFLSIASIGFLANCVHLLISPFWVSCSGNRAVVVTNTTIEIAVPENVMDSVYGENGSNLTRLRQVTVLHVLFCAKLYCMFVC